MRQNSSVLCQWERFLRHIIQMSPLPCLSLTINNFYVKRSTLFFRLSMESNSECRSVLAMAQALEQFVGVINTLKCKYLPYHLGEKLYNYEEDKASPKTESKDLDDNRLPDSNLNMPPWICQPYVRMTPSEHIKKMEEKQLDCLVYILFLILGLYLTENIVHCDLMLEYLSFTTKNNTHAGSNL